MKSRAIPGKNRLFIGFFVFLMVAATFFLLYHTSQQQVDNLRVAGIRCEQHEAALRTQFDSEVDKVNRLEKNLETSRRLENGLQQKLRAEKDLREKTVKDNNLRFTSLQQHYKLLQSEHDDVKAEYANSKRHNLEQMNNYESRIRILTSELAQSDKKRVSSVDEWKFKYTQLEIKFNKLEVALNSKLESQPNAHLLEFKNRQLTEELNEMRKHCAFRLDSGASPPSSSSAVTKGREVLQRSFDEQVLVGENTYQIPIHIKSLGVAASNTNLLLQTSNRTMDLHRSFDDKQRSISSTTMAESLVPKADGIINSVENFQILPKPLANENHNNEQNENVLKEPSLAGESKVAKSSTPTGDKMAQPKALDRALPIAIIQAQSSTAAKPLLGHSQSSSLHKLRKVPEGVVPIPESMNALLHEEEADNRREALNSRYGNIAADPHNLHQAVVSEEQQQQQPNQVNFLQNGNEVENGAHEVNDFNIIEDRNHHDHLQDVLDDEKIVINNNAAEVEGAHAGGEEGEKDKRNEIDLSIINRDVHGGDKKDGLMGKKSNDEFVADQGFDDHMEEHVEEEDDDEYPNLAAQQEEGHAVRN